MYLEGGTHFIKNSTFSNNKSGLRPGGGIYNKDGDLTITNSTISNNTCGVFGGGIANTGNLMLRNVTITNNFATKAGGISGSGFGGGLSHSGGFLSFNNTIIAGNGVSFANTAPGPPEIFFNSGTITSTGNNFIGDSAGDSTNTGTPIAYQPTDIRDISPQLAPLGNYGGTTPTHALLSGSPAINAGNNTNALPTDQRGAPRVGSVDIGAYEYASLTFSISGRVTSDGINGLGGVLVTLSGSSTASVTTNANGEYSFTGLVESGNYTVTPSLANFTFSPLNVSFNNLSGNQMANFRPQCVYSISPTSAVVPPTAGSGSVNVTASAGCGWATTSNVPWIAVTNGMGTGNGTVTYTVAANTGPVRTGTITIAGQTFTVTQNALPTFSINNVSLFEGNSGTTMFTFTVSISGAFNQTATVNYATVNGTATPPTDYQATSGSLSFAPGETSKIITVLVNGDNLIELDETFTVTLSGASNAIILNGQGTGTIQNDDPCTYSISPANLTTSANASSSNMVTITTQSGCTWTATTTESWVTIYSGASGSGSGTVSFAIAANTGPGRTGIITIAGQTLTISQTSGATVPRTIFDFDGDGRADLTVFRASNGFWYELASQNNAFIPFKFGQTGDRIAPADYDGDGRTDFAVWRDVVFGAGNKAYFYITNSSDGSFRPEQFGSTGDVPVSGDWDGDGKSDLAVYRDGSLSGGQGYFFYRPSSAPGVDFRAIAWGTNGDKPVVGDFDGDGKQDAAVFRPSAGTWYILQSSNNQYVFYGLGISTDIPAPADFDGDGRTNIAVFRPSNGTWYTSPNPATNYGAVQFGAAGDLPVPADYDGDGRADIVVFRPSNGTWYLLRTTAGFTGVQFGNNEDKPIPNAYIR